MKIKNSIYEHFYTVRSDKLSLEGYDVDDGEASYEKWYNLSMQYIIADLDETLSKSDNLKNTNLYNDISRLNRLLKENINEPKVLLGSKDRFNLVNLILDIVVEQIDIKKKNVTNSIYDELIEGFEKYVLCVDEWMDLLYVEDLGKQLIEMENFKDCASLKELIEDISYYNSIRSNPSLLYLKDSKALFKKASKEINSRNITSDEKEILDSYFSRVKTYLSALEAVLKNKEKNSTKRK